MFFFLVGILSGKDNLDDEELWHLFLSDDKEAISILFERYYGDLYRYGFKINPNDEAVRDGMQELFLRLWVKRDLLDQAVSVKKYLIVSLRRILIRQLERHDSRIKRNEEYFGVDDHPKAGNGIEDAIINSEKADERRDILKKSLSELTKRQQEVLFLKFYEGYNNREIAKIVHLSYQRVCNISHEALEKLRDIIL